MLPFILLSIAYYILNKSLGMACSPRLVLSTKYLLAIQSSRKTSSSSTRFSPQSTAREPPLNTLRPTRSKRTPEVNTPANRSRALTISRLLKSHQPSGSLSSMDDLVRELEFGLKDAATAAASQNQYITKLMDFL